MIALLGLLLSRECQLKHNNWTIFDMKSAMMKTPLVKKCQIETFWQFSRSDFLEIDVFCSTFECICKETFINLIQMFPHLNFPSAKLLGFQSKFRVKKRIFVL